MDINEAIEILEATFAELGAHQTATRFVLDNATENQRKLVASLAFPHDVFAVRSLAHQQAQKVSV